jgi:hypothetical protein
MVDDRRRGIQVSETKTGIASLLGVAWRRCRLSGAIAVIGRCPELGMVRRLLISARAGLFTSIILIKRNAFSNNMWFDYFNYA